MQGMNIMKMNQYRTFAVAPKRTEFFDFKATLIDGTEINKLDDIVGDKKAILVVNVASEWGVTERDYKQLVQIYDEFKDQGLEILAYPCNQFGSQEPHNEQWICDFVKKYEVKFPMMKKISVFNKRQEPLYKFLRDNSRLEGGDMQWNFEKFLVDSQGHVVGHWWVTEDPNSVRPEIKRLLSQWVILKCDNRYAQNKN